MTAPSQSAVWATDSVYSGTGGPLDGTPNKDQPASGRIDQGWVPGYKTGAQGFNWWMNLVGQWIEYLSVLATTTRHRFPTPLYSTGMSVANSFSGGAGAFAPYGSTYNDPVSSVGFPLGALGVAGDGPGLAQIDLDVPEGFKLTDLTVNLAGQGVGTGTTNLSIVRVLNGDSTVQLLGEISVATPHPAADVTMDLDAASALGLAVIVTTGGGNVVYTRATGSYLTDGFFVGQIVQWSGFTNVGNNQQVTITALTALAMTALVGTAVAETGANASVAGVPPVADSTGELQLIVYMVNTAGNSSAMKDLRTTIAPI